MPVVIQNVYPQVIKHERFNLLLLIYILMNALKDYVPIHLGLTWTYVSEVVILLMTYIIKYVFQTRIN